MGIPGIISVIALVFAMTGGAYAAKDVIGGKANSSAKAKQGKRGPKGPKGAKGDPGAAGAQGAQGAKGDKGDKGDAGTQGPQGPQGIPGKDGSPWTAGGTLPSGETLTGPWGITRGTIPALLPFNIPLAAPLPAARTKYVTAPTADCPGTAAEPKAEEGFLCVYEESGFTEGGTFQAEIRNPGSKVQPVPGLFIPGLGASRAGAILADEDQDFEGFMFGTWAVTAE